jgi:gentisate 1,2-dioxygenase
MQDHILMEFTNPIDGGSVLATISAFARLVPADFVTKPARSIDEMIRVVAEGSRVDKNRCLRIHTPDPPMPRLNREATGP